VWKRSALWSTAFFGTRVNSTSTEIVHGHDKESLPETSRPGFISTVRPDLPQSTHRLISNFYFLFRIQKWMKKSSFPRQIERELCVVCYQKENKPVDTVCREYLCSERTGRANCYIATGKWNNISCVEVPFRELAHSINTYVLDGSEMNVTFGSNLNFNYLKDVPER
jgi:hypothetical protein